MSADICRRFGLDGMRGYLAGIAHDMAKGLPQDEAKRLALRECRATGHRDLSAMEREKPSLLHAKAAATLLREEFGLGKEEEDILEAVRDHTTGSPGMGPLAKAVYIADKVEPGRRGIRADLRAVQGWPSLDSLFQAVLENSVAYLRSREMKPSPGTLRLLAAMGRRP
jgi:nicotinate-nucleotide adenylyltransferase